MKLFLPTFIALLLISFATFQSAKAQAGQSRIKDFGLKEYVRTSKDLPHSENAPWKLVCTLPYNAHFQPWIEAIENRLWHPFLEKVLGVQPERLAHFDPIHQG